MPSFQAIFNLSLFIFAILNTFYKHVLFCDSYKSKLYTERTQTILSLRIFYEEKHKNSEVIIHIDRRKSMKFCERTEEIDENHAGYK